MINAKILEFSQSNDYVDSLIYNQDAIKNWINEISSNSHKTDFQNNILNILATLAVMSIY